MRLYAPVISMERIAALRPYLDLLAFPMRCLLIANTTVYNLVMEFAIATFYQFVEITDVPALQNTLREMGQELGIKGTILLAQEGINATIAAPEPHLRTFFAELCADPRFATMVIKWSYAEFAPFYRFKVKIKAEIVTFRQESADPRKQVGQYVPPNAWNELISDPDVLVIDTRNDFEYGVGTFHRAINPSTNSFSQFADYVAETLNPQQHKKVAMFCTGGIRCEKATAYLLEQGFENVYHLQGGILNYLQHVSPEQSLWQGECFVFDQRVTVDHSLHKGRYLLCRSCWQPLSPEAMQSAEYEEGVSCPRCFATLSETRKASLRERQKQVQLATARGEQHIGRTPTDHPKHHE